MTLDAPLPEALYTAQQVREMDRIAIEDYGVNGFELMQKAARFTFHVLLKKWPQSKHICVICGSGNNAGDGYIIAALAKKRGLTTTLLSLSDPEKLMGDAQLAYHYAQEQGVIHQPFSAQHWATQSSHKDLVIVDALLGTGLNTEVRGHYKEAIELCNQGNAPVLAVDIPSGLSADTGQAMGIAIEAECTATFIGLKLGMLTGSGRRYCGRLYFDELDIAPNIIEQVPSIARRLDLETLLPQLKPRLADSHKGRCGHVLLIGGDHGYGGAIIMAAEAAARSGAGLVSVATQAEHCSALLARQPEIMVKSVSNIAELSSLLKKASVLVVGPGLGQSAWSQQMLVTALKSNIPTILDADALNLIALHSDWLPQNRQHLVMTPHPGEAARLLERSSTEIQSDRMIAVKNLQKKWGSAIILKGSGSLIAHLDQTIRICPYGNPGMATGGMGDVLSGILGGLIAQGIDKAYALELGVCLHAAAADIAADKYGQRGLLASDIMPHARQLLNGLTDF